MERLTIPQEDMIMISPRCLQKKEYSKEEADLIGIEWQCCF